MQLRKRRPLRWRRGVRVAVVRLPQVHDTVKQGLITYAIQSPARRAFQHMWAMGSTAGLRPTSSMPPVSTSLALKKGEAGARYHAVARRGSAVRDIAEVIGRGLNVPVVSISPEEAAGHFGWLGMFVGWDIPASSAQTRDKLGWNPTGPSLLTDLENMRYS